MSQLELRLWLIGFEHLEHTIEHTYEHHKEKYAIEARKTEDEEDKEAMEKGWKLTTFNHLRHIPIPGELLVVIICTLLGWLANLEKYDVEMVGEIDKGYHDIPARLAMPDGKEWEMIGLAFLITICGYFAAVSLMKVIAEDKQYRIYPNQELIALGLTNIISALFGAFPAFLNLARTCVFFEAGAESQFSAALSVLVMLFFKEVTRSFFKYTPKSCLAAIVWFSVFKIYGHFDGIRKLMTIDRLDALVWFIAWLAVTFLDVVLGLSTGLLCCIFSIVIRSQMASATTLARMGDTEMYEDNKRYYRNSSELRGIKIIKFLGPLHYINRQQFRDEIDRICERNQRTGIMSQEAKENIEILILDCSCISYLDYGGIKELADTIMIYQRLGISTFLAEIQLPVLMHIRQAKSANQLEFDKVFNLHHIFPKVHDAVCRALLCLKEEVEENTETDKSVSSKV